MAVLNGGGEETRVVGGAIRNALLRRPVIEVDCTTTALPDETTRRAQAAGLKVVPTGIEHGTVTVIVEGEPFEVTTLREDVETDGRHAVVRFGRDFRADAERRDFTINALSLGADGALHDYTGGVADLAAGRVRFIGEARRRIREDYLRTLRFFRFFAEYAAGAPDTEGMAAAIAEREGLGILSPERIRAEILKLLVTRRAAQAVRVMSDAGFVALLFGGVAEIGRFERVVAAEGEADPVRRLAALAVLVPEDADRLRERLRLSNEEHRRLLAYGLLVPVLKTRPIPLDGAALRPLVAEHGVEAVADALLALGGEPQPILAPDALPALGRLRSGEEPVPVFPLKGTDLLAAGIAPGPAMGELLRQARQAWLAAGCPVDPAMAQSLLERTIDRAAGLAIPTRH
jgi:poly(A) polymerase